MPTTFDAENWRDLGTDTHAHLTWKDFDGDVDGVLSRSLDASIGTIVQIALGPKQEDIEEAHRLVRAHGRVFMAVGLHPHDADAFSDDVERMIGTCLSWEKVVALGEIGLDYHYDNSKRDNQRHAFQKLCRLARQHQKPICIHTREAWDDTFEILKDVKSDRSPFVIHCFSGGPQEAQRVLDMGGHLSISGIVTFKKAQAIRDAVHLAPMDRLFIETDSPYLAPIPHRGKRNEPAYTKLVAETVADIKGLSVQEVLKQTTTNADRFFGFSNLG